MVNLCIEWFFCTKGEFLFCWGGHSISCSLFLLYYYTRFFIVVWVNVVGLVDSKFGFGSLAPSFPLVVFFF